MNHSYAQKFDELSVQFKPYVEKDRYRFLCNLSKDKLESGTIFDFQHQTLLRLWLQQDHPDAVEEIVQYVRNIDTRLNILDRLKTHASNDVSKFDEISIPKVGMRYYSQDHSLLAQTLGRNVNEEEEKDICYFVNNGGFGLYSLQEYADLGSNNNVYATKSSLNSVGAAMYYAFNTSSPTAYLQMNSIRVLSASINALQYAAWDIESFQQSNIAHSISLLPQTAASGHSLTQAFSQMFGSHELGHRPTHNGNRYLIDLLEANNLDDSLLFRVGFPNTHDLQSWRRIRDGQGSVSDVLFLLGDTLANIAFIQEMPSQEVIAALRIFLSWLVREPRPSQSPRGNTALYLYLHNGKLEGLMNSVERLIVKSIQQPEEIESEFLKFEFDAWNTLLNEKITKD